MLGNLAFFLLAFVRAPHVFFSRGRHKNRAKKKRPTGAIGAGGAPMGPPALIAPGALSSWGGDPNGGALPPHG